MLVGRLTLRADVKSRPALAEKPDHEVTSEEMADLIYGVYVRPSRKRGMDQALALERADAHQYDGRTNKFDPNRSRSMPTSRTRLQKHVLNLVVVCQIRST